MKVYYRDWEVDGKWYGWEVRDGGRGIVLGKVRANKWAQARHAERQWRSMMEMGDAIEAGGSACERTLRRLKR